MTRRCAKVGTTTAAIRPVLWGLLAAAMATGCFRSSTPRYYVLAPTETASKAARVSMTVGLGPFRLAEYLDRVDIVERQSATALKLNTNHLWAEPLATSFVATTAANLRVLLGTERIAIHPWDGDAPDVAIRATVHRFDVDRKRVAHLHVSWSLSRRGVAGGAIRSSRFEEKAKGKSVEDATLAMSRALGSFSRVLADAIRAAR